MTEFAASLRLASGLFAFWVLLSGKLDAAHLGAGAASALMIAVAARRLLRLPPAIGARGKTSGGIRWGRVLLYVPWLAFEILRSAGLVAYVVLHPRMPIAPRLVRFQAGLPHTLARLTLANSITLTPGTVTLEVERDAYLVHALTESSARTLERGAMRRRVAALFEAGPNRRTTDVFP